MCTSCEENAGYFRFEMIYHSFSCVIKHIDLIIQVMDDIRLEQYVFDPGNPIDTFDRSCITLEDLKTVKSIGENKNKALLNLRHDEYTVRKYCSKVLKGEFKCV